MDGCATAIPVHTDMNTVHYCKLKGVGLEACDSAIRNINGKAPHHCGLH